jgi:hypothetical protein
MNSLRWLFVLPFMIVGLLTGTAVSIAVFVLGEWTCPEEYVASDLCFAPWTDIVYYGALSSGAAVSAALSVLFAAFIAPIRKPAVARIAFAAGIVAAAYIIYMEVFSRGFEIRHWNAFTYVFFFSAALAIGAGYWMYNVVRRCEALPWLWQKSRS